MTYRAVLFDLDGTLLDTIDDLADSMNAALAGLGCAGHNVAAYKYFVGDGVVNLALRALPEDRRDDATVNACVTAMRAEYGRRWANKTRPYPGIPELLDGLVSRGIRMAILSNKPDDFTKMTVGRLLSRWRFDAVAGAHPNGPKKPDPSAALEIVLQVKVPAEEFLYLGDTNTDMQTAIASGMFPVGALWGFRTADELMAHGAQVLIADPRELLGLL